MLMQLHINGDDDIQAYSKTIREWLETNEERPTTRRRAIADPRGSSSLRLAQRYARGGSRLAEPVLSHVARCTVSLADTRVTRGLTPSSTIVSRRLTSSSPSARP